ncbi:MAG: transposase [Pyrinomonadaceae bacterium]
MKTRKIRIEAVSEYLRGGTTLEKVGRRYGVSKVAVHHWVREHKSGKGPDQDAINQIAGILETREGAMPDDVGRLKRELREARLHTKLLEAMIDIAEEQMGIVIRKKPGAKQ